MPPYTQLPYFFFLAIDHGQMVFNPSWSHQLAKEVRALTKSIYSSLLPVTVRGSRRPSPTAPQDAEAPKW